MFLHIYKRDLKFPKDYPTGCLLGCVNMTDCLSQEQYKEQVSVTTYLPTHTLLYTGTRTNMPEHSEHLALCEGYVIFSWLV
ncbi:unnamed protein product [Oncorhynchus mykiss]|uniref:Uncharacterized protein n=1 Tax=Oncorhynchus mykiss TaxID=8022 RepID=A0A060ZAT5_ONCMY|nr:unnamed protein product [Oncorhynchus mykiss]